MAKVEDSAEFQFHKGAIRTTPSQERKEAAPRFQFHKGAIRTLLDAKQQLDIIGFQFHKGAIRTCCRYQYPRTSPISIP